MQSVCSTFTYKAPFFPPILWNKASLSFPFTKALHPFVLEGKQKEKSCKNKSERNKETQNTTITVTPPPLFAPIPHRSVFDLPLYQYVHWTVPGRTNSVETDKNDIWQTEASMRGAREWESDRDETTLNDLGLDVARQGRWGSEKRHGEDMVEHWMTGPSTERQSGVRGGALLNAECACLYLFNQTQNQNHFWNIGGLQSAGLSSYALEVSFNRLTHYPLKA